ncbi:hypothetical protein FPHYL_6347 [Fusarium phyllophilum]|uniref:Uncharacterized protein n=1 Tax=Fusarium phyllophilum TaxID=47803 RepID=A0A8H5NDH9_9HYPO|nr:hypothetical protein FPHYL_6347 [Fusarium phyllophilum]
MEDNDSSPAASDEYNLNHGDFSREITTGHSQWRSSQVDSVLASFEEAKKVMSAQAIHEIHNYLKSGRWIHDALTASRHPAYKTMKGHSGGNSKGKLLFYYPYFFVLQAIFPPSDPLSIVCEDMSRYWGLRVNVHDPFYPRLQDSKREMDLIMGKIPHLRTQVERPSLNQSSNTVFTPTHDGNSEMEDQEGSIQVVTDIARASQPVPTSASDTLRNYDEELANFRSENDSERSLRGVQDKTKEIRDHVVKAEEQVLESQVHATMARENAAKAEQHSSMAHEYAKAAIRLADALIESLNNTAERPAILVPDEERPNKRVREN